MSPAESAATGDLRHFKFEPSGPVKGAAVFVHGHGDFSARYEDILAPFVERGICCFTSDLPGHGESPGKRGFVPGFPIVDQVVRENLGRAREACPHGPLGLMGHSAGGLLALRELLNHMEEYEFTWISSPLLRPGASRHPITVHLLRLAAKLFPGLALDTGVTPAECRHLGDDEKPEDAPNQLFHSQISLGWGRKLLLAAEEVREGYQSRTVDIPALFTQGEADPVCPPQYLREFLSAANFTNLTHLELEDQLHEPFIDTAAAEVQADIGSWLDQVLQPA